MKRCGLALVMLIGAWHIPFAGAQSQSGKPLAFEVASIKLDTSDPRTGVALQYLPGGRYHAKNVPLLILIADAYSLPLFSPDRLKGGPDWLRTDRYDIEASASKDAIPAGASSKVRNDTVRLMVQTLLADRFKMVIHRETKDLPVYVIEVAKGGPKLEKAKVDDKDCAQNTTSFADPASCHNATGGQGQGIHGNALDLADVALFISSFSDRPVIDKTGLAGLYNIQTEGWVPLRPRPPRPAGQPPSAEDLAFADPARPTIFAVLDRLGLKMESQRAPVETYEIESISRPSEN